MTQAAVLAQMGNTNQTFRNRIINGNMVIDQRNAGASVTPTNNSYSIDRWAYGATQASKFTAQQNAGSVTPPAGFVKYLGITSSSAYSVLSGDLFQVKQPIEGYNIADLSWGTADAKTVTLSFWVRSSLTGTFSGALLNSDGTRSYVFTYTISSANTWEQKSVTISGDISGTWNTTSSIGMSVIWSLGTGSTYSTSTTATWSGSLYTAATGATSVVGTNGATFYITGVQLEKGTVATPFEQRLYGTELALCQRYYYKMTVDTISDGFCIGANDATTYTQGYIAFPVQMRTSPTSMDQSGTAGHYNIRSAGSSTTCNTVPTINNGTVNGVTVLFWVASGLTNGYAATCGAANTSAYLGFPAEL